MLHIAGRNGQGRQGKEIKAYSCERYNSHIYRGHDVHIENLKTIIIHTLHAYVQKLFMQSKENILKLINQFIRVIVFQTNNFSQDSNCYKTFYIHQEMNKKSLKGKLIFKAFSILLRNKLTIHAQFLMSIFFYFTVQGMNNIKKSNIFECLIHVE